MINSQIEGGLFCFAASVLNEQYMQGTQLGAGDDEEESKEFRTHCINKHLAKKHRQIMHYLYIKFFKKKVSQQEQIFHTNTY